MTALSEAQSLRDAVARVETAIREHVYINWRGHDDAFLCPHGIKAAAQAIGAHIAKIEAERDAAQDHLAKVASVVKAAAIGEWTDNYEAMVEEACAFEERARTAEAQVATLTARIAELEAALEPFAKAWDQCEAIGEQGGGYPQDDDAVWVSCGPRGNGYSMFEFGHLRAARSAITQKDTDR